MWWHKMTHGREVKGKLANGVGSQYPFTLPRNVVYPALPPLMHTPRLLVVDWTDAPADLNGLVRFAERRNPVSARVKPHFNWPLLQLYIWKFSIRAMRQFAPHKSKKYTDLFHLYAHCSTKWVLPSAWLNQRNGYISKLMPRSTNKRMENLHYEEFRNCKHHRTLLQLSTEGRWDGPDMGIKELCRKSW